MPVMLWSSWDLQPLMSDLPSVPLLLVFLLLSSSPSLGLRVHTHPLCTTNASACPPKIISQEKPQIQLGPTLPVSHLHHTPEHTAEKLTWTSRVHLDFWSWASEESLELCCNLTFPQSIQHTLSYKRYTTLFLLSSSLQPFCPQPQCHHLTSFSFF